MKIGKFKQMIGEAESNKQVDTGEKSQKTSRKPVVGGEELEVDAVQSFNFADGVVSQESPSAKRFLWHLGKSNMVAVEVKQNQKQEAEK